MVIGFCLVKLIFHFLTNTNYELHRDAFLYIELGNHLDWGFHSVPPSIGVFANISRFILGDTTFAIRFFPAVVGCISIFLIGLMVKELGGNRWAQGIACLAFLTSPAFLRSNTLFQPVSFNQFYWLLLSFLIFRLIRTGKPGYWIWFGIVAGLAFLNKYSVVFYLAGFVLALLLGDLRKWLKTWHPYAAAGIALLIALPNLIWQYSHQWPVVSHMKELADTQLVHVRIDLFILEQFLMNIPAVIIWMAGLIYILFVKTGKSFRIFGILYLFVILQLIILRGKHYYTLGLYSTLFVFGGFIIAEWFKEKWRFVKHVVIALNLILALLVLPISLPVLNPDQFIRFMNKIGMEKSQRWEDGEYYDLPQDYADMIGWNELTAIVNEAFCTLSKEQQEKCSIFANNYGEAGSVNFFGRKYGLPTVISFNDSYIFWAPDSIHADYVIKIGDDPNLYNLYHNVEIFKRLSNPHARQYGTPVYICSDQKIDVNAYYQAELKELRSE